MLTSRNRFIISTLGFISCLSVTASNAVAITIKPVFQDPSTPQPADFLVNEGSQLFYQRPILLPNSTGTGNLETIFEAATDYLEQFFSDPFSVVINYGWSDLSAISATGLEVSQVFDSQGRIVEANIYFDVNNPFFLDPTPFQDLFNLDVGNSEFMFDEDFRSSDLGGGIINTGFELLADPNDNSVNEKFDLFTVALHEIGHALGIDNNFNGPRFTNFSQESLDGDIDISNPLPFAGTEVPTTGVHLDLPLALMRGGRTELNLTLGRRTLPSTVDILAIAQVNRFENINLPPRPVPEPGILIGLVTVAGVGVVRAISRIS